MWVPKEKLIKNAISVYDPADPWEKAIQDASKAVTGSWLSSYPCQLLAKAVVALQCNEEWIDREDLMPARAHYMFTPSLISNKQDLVFVTHLLFLRDILENNEINSQLHQPIAFLTRPLAHFLFRHCPVHMLLKADLLRSANRKVEFQEIGGFVIVSKGDVSLEGAISDVHYHGSHVDAFMNLRDDAMPLRKAAGRIEVDDVGEETVYSSEHFRALRINDRVWDKEKKLEGRLEEIEPVINGDIVVEYDNGEIQRLSKEKFDESYIVLPRGEESNVLQPLL